MNKFFLIGMPAAGKTTAGKFISKNTNLKLFDLDIEIEKYYGKEIKDIFKRINIFAGVSPDPEPGGKGFENAF